MWYLVSESDPRNLYILSDKDIVVGRSVDAQICNFALPEDSSISRKHAILSISDNNLFVQDLGSRYGTFVNNSSDRLESNSSLRLNVNDVVKFGKLSSVWKVNKVDFVTCTSTLKGENILDLKKILDELGGKLKNDWDDTCTYLTMPAITLTIKAVLALVHGSFIVTTEYWNKCFEAVNNNTKLPDPKEFVPVVIESTLNKENLSFLPDIRRQKLFAGKKFIFFSKKQLEMYKTVLIKSSATPLLLSESKMTKSMLCDKDAIVIQYNFTNISQDTQSQRDQINDLVNYLKSRCRRVIPDAEIGLAILYCSKDKYCNPEFNLCSEVIKQTNDQNKQALNVLAQESQEHASTVMQNKKDNVVINESLTSNNSINTVSNNMDKQMGFKRKLSGDDESQKNKKIALDIENKTEFHVENAKRKFCADFSTTESNPAKKLAVDNKDSTENEDIFNFNNSVSTNKEKSVDNKLNFLKPMKRKIDMVDKEENIFNFIQDKPKPDTNTETKTSIFHNSKQSSDSNHALETEVKKNDDIDVSAMRGIKLKELMQSNLNWNTNVNAVKKEVTDELDAKMNDLELGTTIVKVRSDLIVKKEPLHIEEHSSTHRNFKKFKKVWPVKMQVTIIPKSSMSVINFDASDVNETNPLSN